MGIVQSSVRQRPGTWRRRNVDQSSGHSTSEQTQGQNHTHNDSRSSQGREAPPEQAEQIQEPESISGGGAQIQDPLEAEEARLLTEAEDPSLLDGTHTLRLQTEGTDIEPVSNPPRTSVSMNEDTLSPGFFQPDTFPDTPASAENFQSNNLDPRSASFSYNIPARLAKSSSFSTTQAKNFISFSCSIRSKTREHDGRPEHLQEFTFHGLPNKHVTIGSNKNCDLVLRDDRCDRIHAHIQVRAHKEFGLDRYDLFLVHEARMYRKLEAKTKQVLRVGDVIKAGTLSLEVVGMNAHFGDTVQNTGFLLPYQLMIVEKMNPETNAVEKYVSLFDSYALNQSLSLQSPTSDNYVRERKEYIDLEQETHSQDESNDEIRITEPTYTYTPVQAEADMTPLSAVMCYICWDGLDPNQHQNHLHHTSTEDDAVFNPMIKNPCGSCSGSSKFIHFQCLMRWIESSKSGQCSICNGNLPPNFCPKPPNMELKIVRHRKGVAWTGTRRYRLSFADGSKRIVGSSPRAYLTISEGGVENLHFLIGYNDQTKHFYVQNKDSLQGTFMYIKEPVLLNGTRNAGTEGGTVLTEFKLGRSVMTMEVSPNKATRGLLRKFLGKKGMNLKSTSFSASSPHPR